MWDCLIYEYYTIVFQTCRLQDVVYQQNGGGTLGLYTTHIAIYTLLIKVFGSLVLDSNSSFVYTLYVIALFTSITILSILTCTFLKRNKYLSFLFLGKNKKNENLDIRN